VPFLVLSGLSVSEQLLSVTAKFHYAPLWDAKRSETSLFPLSSKHLLFFPPFKAHFALSFLSSAEATVY